jgi:protein TonB
MLVLAFALAAQPPSAVGPAAPVAMPARAVQWLSNYVGMSDYPAEARRLRQQGVVRYELTIGTNGRPIACRVLTSSGSPSLDEATCRVMGGRARFHPARDAAGRPTIDRIRHSINWIYPDW